MRTLAACLFVLVLVSSSATAQSRSFPMVTLADEGLDGLLVQLDPAAAQGLASLREVVLADVPISGARSVTLDLERVLVATPDARIDVDGAPWLSATEIERDVTLWSGRVAGDPASDVFLSFSPYGSRGWIDTGDELVHLLAGPGGADGWAASVTRVVTDARLRDLGGAPTSAICATPDAPRPDPELVHAPNVAPSSYAGGSGIVYEARLALETDTDFYNLFGDLDAARAYALALFGSVSNRYREQLDTIPTLAYLGLYTGVDPWTTPESGGNSIDMLNEFLAAWDGGAAPVTADIYNMISGASLGGGVAYLSVLCHQDFGFGISGNLGGITPFPIVQGPLNWDFMVTAHELGHNFGTSHTHNFCPPIDECAPDGYFGACQTQQVCTSSGTIMSYCHLCDGGLENITTYFHPLVVDTIRAFVEQFTCLQPFRGVFAEDLGGALAGGGATPALDVSWTQPDTMVLEHSDAPAGATAYLVLGLSELSAPFKGGVLVPAATLVAAFGAPAADFDIELPLDVSIPSPDGFDLWTQTWFVDASGPVGFTSTNGLQLEIVVSEPWPDLVWISHPSNGLEYAASNPGNVEQIRAEALANGATLASVDGGTLNGWLTTSFAGATAQGTIYLGYSDELSEGTFVWDDGTPFGYENWAGGEPNNFGASGEDFAELNLSSGEWNDIPGWGYGVNRAILQR